MAQTTNSIGAFVAVYDCLIALVSTLEKVQLPVLLIPIRRSDCMEHS